MSTIIEESIIQQTTTKRKYYFNLRLAESSDAKPRDIEDQLYIY